jgi:hypothetical protein
MLPGRPSCQPRVPVDRVRRSQGDLYGHPKVRRTVVCFALPRRRLLLSAVPVDRDLYAPLCELYARL